MKKILTLVCILGVVALFAGCSWFPSVSSVKEEVNSDQIANVFDYSNIEYKEDEVMVKVSSQIDLEQIINKKGSEVIKEWSEIGWALVSVPEGETVISFIEQLKTINGILLAEPNMAYEIDVAPVLERYPDQWAFENINAEAAWDISTGSENVIVAIIDTGVDILHTEFADKKFVGTYDATGDGSTVDLSGHGTHVAGIAADNGRSGIIAGVAWDCPIMPIRG